jgi:ParB/RepB/Spo0J family partition protein
MKQELLNIDINIIDPHPQNPRLVQREDVIEAITANINGHGFDPAHAILVRPVGDRLQIVSGHHRYEAARRAGLESVAAWVREMDDETAYDELLKCNAQSELSALEKGFHALGETAKTKGKHGRDNVLAYAKKHSFTEASVRQRIKAAEVADQIRKRLRISDLQDKAHHLAEVHEAPQWLWLALVEKVLADKLSGRDTRHLVSEFKGMAEPFSWLDAAAIARALVNDEMKRKELEKLGEARERAINTIDKQGMNAEKHKAALEGLLAKDRPSRLPQAIELCQVVIDAQLVEIRAEHARQQAERARELEGAREEQEREKRVRALRVNISLKEWKQLDDPTKATLLDIENATGNTRFNEQKNEAIEWAQFSWNPVTGCEHNCPYCYARDIANSRRMEELYPNKFEPTFRPNSLLAPYRMKVPPEAEKDTRFRNVFTCSMADLFGRWVPAEWIEAVLKTVRANPQWNFLFLTKFPQRFSEFDIPSNAWMGTTVDLQARVKNAEKQFAKLKSGVRWLSIEPMLEPLKFERLDLFDWIVIGGSSPSEATEGYEATPEWRPPFEWIADLTRQAREAGCKVYHKTNLLGSRVLELPFDAPIECDPSQAPKVFHYLGKANASEAA